MAGAPSRSNEDAPAVRDGGVRFLWPLTLDLVESLEDIDEDTDEGELDGRGVLDRREVERWVLRGRWLGDGRVAMANGVSLDGVRKGFGVLVAFAVCG